MSSGPPNKRSESIIVIVESFKTTDNAIVLNTMTNNVTSCIIISIKTYPKIEQFITDCPANIIERTFAPQHSSGYSPTTFNIAGILTKTKITAVIPNDTPSFFKNNSFRPRFVLRSRFITFRSYSVPRTPDALYTAAITHKRIPIRRSFTALSPNKS